MEGIRKTKDELLKEIASLRKQVEQLERYKQYENAATETKALHTAFVESGFTNEQAFELLKTMFESSFGVNK